MTTQPPATTLDAPDLRTSAQMALKALEESIDLVRDEYTADWRHGIPTRSKQLEQMKDGVEAHEAAIEALRASLAKEPASPIALTDAQIDQLHRNSYESTVALARFRRIVRLVEGAHRIGDAAPKGQGEKP